MDAPTDIAIVEEVAAQGIPKPRPWLSVLQRRRWETFKANRRGFWSLWIFLLLFVLSLFAEFIANDKPILVKYEGQLLLADLQVLSGDRFRRHLRDRGRVSRPRGQDA